MQWTPDVAAGDWIRERLDDPWRGTMHDVVPRGFATYARVFHPATRDRPVGSPWPPLPHARHREQWDAFQASNPQIDVESVTWATTAAAMGTTMHPLAQWSRLIAPGVIVENEDGPRDHDGWRYSDPPQGGLEPATLSALANILRAQTTTPDAGGIAVWDGWGDLVGAMRVGSSRSGLFGSAGMPRRYAEYMPVEPEDGNDGEPGVPGVAGTPPDPGAPGTADDAVANRHFGWLSASLHDFFNNPFQKPTWHPGILSDEISRGPRLQLLNRDFVLFRGGVGELTDPDWVRHAPWTDHVPERYGGEPSAQSPAIVWPDDHAWVMVTEIDWDSTIVAGSADLVAAIVADPRLEAAQIPAGADLQWDADEVNR